MKTLLSIFCFFSIGILSAQNYVSKKVNNFACISPMEIFIRAGEPFYLLNDNNGEVTKTYILANMTSPTYVAPTLPAGWSVMTLYRPNDVTWNLNFGEEVTFILDNNNNSWLQVH